MHKSLGKMLLSIVKKHKNTIATVVIISILVTLFVIVIGFVLRGLGESFTDFAIWSGVNQQASGECLALEYSDYDVVKEGGKWIAYCTRMVNGTSETVPLSQLVVGD